MATIRENRLFLGNPGTGKSTLINCLLGESKLKSGLSWGRGLTRDYERVDHNGVAYMDTPGLADTVLSEQAAQAITMALKQGGTYKLFFMLRLQSGRVVSEDLVALERVLGALDVAATTIRFSVIFNNVDKTQYATLMQPGSDAFAAVHRVVNRRQFQTDAFCFIPEITTLSEAEDAVTVLPQHVRDFIDETAPLMEIDPRVVRNVDSRDFDQQARKIKEEMDTLLQWHKTISALRTTQQHSIEAVQRERDAIAQSQAHVSSQSLLHDAARVAEQGATIDPTAVVFARILSTIEGWTRQHGYDRDGTAALVDRFRAVARRYGAEEISADAFCVHVEALVGSQAALEVLPDSAQLLSSASKRNDLLIAVDKFALQIQKPAEGESVIVSPARLSISACTK